MTEKRATVGKIVSDLIGKTDEKPINIIDLEKGMQEDYIKNLEQCATDGYKAFENDFFVVVETKRERLMDKVLRNYFIARQTCPTPAYDQTVFKFDRSTGDLTYIWTIPAKDVCYYLSKHAKEVAPAEKELLGFVLLLADGSLDRLAKRLNGEEPDPLALVQ